MINTPEELRRRLLHAIDGVLDGKVSVPQANSVAVLTHELHQSIRQQWDMAVYAVENMSAAQCRVGGLTVDENEVIAGDKQE